MSTSARANRAFSPWQRPSVFLGIAVAAALAFGGCGGSPEWDFVFVNRTDAVLAFGPDVIVPPCSSIGYSEATLREAGTRLFELAQNDVFGDEEAWVPEGATLVYGWPSQRIGAAAPLTWVLSGTKPAYVEYGPVSEASLPACGGSPRLDPMVAPN